MTTIHFIALACAVLAVSPLGATAGRSGDSVPEPIPPSVVLQPPAVLAMSSPRAVHAAVTLPDGKVALIGGCVIDGCDPGPGSRTVDIFNPRTNRVRQGGTLALSRLGTAAVALADGRILIAGGWSGRQVTASVEIFDPKTGTSAEVGRLRTPRGDIGHVTLSDGRVALIGGVEGARAVGDVDIFDPRTGRLTPGPSLLTPRASAMPVRLGDGRILVTGGAENAGSRRVPSAASEIADVKLTKWRATGPLAHARYKHAVVALADGRALVVGGSDSRDRQGKITAMEVFDGVRNGFAAAGRTLRPRFKIGGGVAVLGDGRVFIGAGAEQPEVYDPRSKQSTLVDVELGAVRSFATVSLLPDGRVLIAGGYEENSIAVSRGLWLVRP
jgi:hypothetical protein